MRLDASRDLKAPARPVRVLVVDDEPMERRLVREFLGPDERVEIVGEASSAEEAFALTAELEPDVVLMDIRMPGIGGVEATRHLQRIAPDVQVVALTNFDDPETVRWIVEAGAAGYVVKGEEIGSLVRAVLAAWGGEALLSPSVAKTVMGEVVKLYRQERARADELESNMRAVSHALTAAIEARDADTSEHSTRVVRLAMAVLSELDPVAARDPLVEYGFLLHDVGKIAVRDAVLLKPGPLDPDEWRQMKQHPLFGAQILGQIDSLRGSAAVDVVRHHHERWDGGGYPHGLRRAAIPSACRAFAVVDAFDAMTTDRPYRRCISMADALEELTRHRGTQFDPDAVDILLELVARPTRG